MELYHFGFSTCSQKVGPVLAEKGVDFTSREVNLLAGEPHDPEYVKLNPKHVVPTLVHEEAGNVVVGMMARRGAGSATAAELLGVGAAGDIVLLFAAEAG